MNRHFFTLVVVILVSITTSAPAAVQIIWIDPNEPGLTVGLGYNCTAGEKVAAFALDISVDAGAIIDVNNYHVGVSTAASPGYGIFPANFDRYITVNADGEVDDWGIAGYSPVADANDKGAAGGLGSAAITLEFGGLWEGDANAPPSSGMLCTITLSEPALISAVTNSIRGNVVLVDGTEAIVDLTPPWVPFEPCFPMTDPAYADWVALGKPECWCIKTQCHGDADGLKEGNDKTGYYRVHFRDLNVLLVGWDVMEPAGPPTPSGIGITNVSFTDTLGTVNGVCADFAHNVEGSAKTGYYRVHFSDLNILVTSWYVREPATGSTPSGEGIRGDCPGTISPEP